MAELKAHKPFVTLTATFTLDEEEIAALDALAGYGEDSFLKVFYKEMGEAYMKPHEAGLRRIFKAIRGYAGGAISSAHEARKVLRDNEVARLAKRQEAGNG